MVPCPHCTSRRWRIGLSGSQPRQRHSAGWLELVNEPPPASEQARIRSSLKRNSPLGSDNWTNKTAAKLGLTHTINPRGRPKCKEKT